jgi:hypothetical protein
MKFEGSAGASPYHFIGMKPIDMHVHIVGKGCGGTGCWMRPSGWHLPMAAFMLRHIGLPLSALRGDFYSLFVERLFEHVLGSSLGVIVILAQDQV